MDLAVFLDPSSDSAYTRACLESLARTLPSRVVHETILCESPEWTPPSGVSWRVLPRDPTRGLAAVRNAAAAARAPRFLFLSSGTVCLANFLPPMLDLLRRAPHAGCIGSVQREPYSGLIDQAGVRFDEDGLPVATGRDGALLPRETSARHPAVSFACCLVTRELFERLNGFDERFQGPLGDVDFCLRAAALGYRHYVANRSVVYHDAGADALDALLPSARDADFALYRDRWGERARAAHLRRAMPRSGDAAPSYSREDWEMAREVRRLRRQTARDTRRKGLVYLCRHLHRPWRYDYEQLCEALAKAFPPLPAVLPPTPGRPFHDTADLTRLDDGWLFDPPPR